MTLQQYIMYLIKNYQDANMREFKLTRNGSFKRRADEALELYAEFQKAIKNADLQNEDASKINLKRIKDLYDRDVCEKNSRNMLKSLDVLLDKYFDKANQAYNSEANQTAAPDLQMPQYDPRRTPVADLQMLPSIAEWHNYRDKTTQDFDAVNIGHQERLQQRNNDIAEAVKQLADSAKQTWGGSHQYKDFQKTMIKLNDAIQHPDQHPNVNTQALFDTALEQAQIYLNYKANDQEINKRGRERAEMVSNMLHKLAQYDFAEQGNKAVFGVCEVRAYQVSVNDAPHQKKAQQEKQDDEYRKKVEEQKKQAEQRKIEEQRIQQEQKNTLKNQKSTIEEQQLQIEEMKRQIEKQQRKIEELQRQLNAQQPAMEAVSEPVPTADVQQPTTETNGQKITSITDVKFSAENATLKELDKHLSETYKQLQELDPGVLLDAHGCQLAADAIQYAAMKRLVLNDMARLPDNPKSSTLFQYTNGCTFQDFKNNFAKFDEFYRNPDVCKPNRDSALAYVQDMSSNGPQNQMAKAVGQKIINQMVQMSKPKGFTLRIANTNSMTLGGKSN